MCVFLNLPIFPLILSTLPTNGTHAHNSVWVDITVEEDRCGAASEWEVVMAPMTEDDNENEENEENEEKEEEQEEQGGAKEEEKDEAWVRWEKELACLSEMGFFTQLDACVAVLERLRPTDAEVSLFYVCVLVCLSLHHLLVVWCCRCMCVFS